ncbi:MAG: 2-phosphosulfolactate phosphatase, partial [Thermoproteota archaeon]
ACKRAGIVVACALVNLKATAKCLLHTNYRKFILVAAGTKDETALEDVYTAGALIHRMLEEKAFLLTDAAILAYQLYQKFGPNAYEVFKISQNGVHLIKIGLEDDLYFAARMDRFETVPILQNGRLV